MTRIEAIKFIIWGDVNSDVYSDSVIDEWIELLGYNGTIKQLAEVELANTPVSINDGANTINNQSRIDALKGIISKSGKNGYKDPINRDIKYPKYWLSELK